MRNSAIRKLRADLGLDVADSARVSVGTDRRTNDPRRGFAHFGEFAQAVAQAARPGVDADSRLFIGAAAPGTAGSESAGQDGGFTVPPEFAEDVLILPHGSGESVIPLCDQNETLSNAMVFPKDEATPWGSSAVRALWANENTAATQVKPQIGSLTLRTSKLMCFVPVSEELVEDSATLNRYLPKKASEAILWKANDAIFKGAGNGQPLGILNAPATIVQAKESGQLTATFALLNCTNMLSRLTPGSFNRAVWIVDATALPALLALNASVQVFFPNGGTVPGTDVASIGILLGRPVIVTQHAATFSTQGDLILADFSYYRWLQKAGGIAAALSLHMYFDAYACAMRFTFRCDGSPSIAAPISPPKGSLTLSPFIQLAAR